jgi:hypothetical protein
MRRPTIIAYFPRLGVTVLGGTLLLSTGYATDAHAAPKAPKSAGGAAAPDPTGGGDAAAGPDAKTKKAARDEYAAGEKAYKSGDYTGAFDRFKKAYDLIPNIHAKYWMAMAQSYGSDQTAAYDALVAVTEAPDKSKLGDEKLGAANGRLEELKKTPASLTITSTPAGATVSVDGSAKPGETPATLSITAGSHYITVMKPGFELYETDVTAKPGQKMDQTVELKAKSGDPFGAPGAGASAGASAAIPAAPPPKETAPPQPPPKEERSKLPAYITLGVGVVGAGLGTVFGVMALSAKSDFDQNPTSENADKAERNALIADMSFGVALTLGITGIVLLTTAGDDSSEVSAKRTLHHAPRAKLDVAPILTHTTQGAAARFVF